MRLAIFLSLSLLSIANTASAGPRLRWSVDTIHVIQRGCSSHVDSFLVTITNVGDSIETLRSVNGHSDRWKIAGYDTLKEIDMQPGDSKDVKIYFTAYRNGYALDRAISRTQSRTEDTIYLITDVFVSELYMRDTNRVPAHEFVPDDSIFASFVFNVDGNIPFAVKELKVEGDPEIEVHIEPRSDTLSTSVSQYFYCVLRPTAVKTYTATISIQGTECDSIFRKTVIFPIVEKSGVADNVRRPDIQVVVSDKKLTVQGVEGHARYEIINLSGGALLAGAFNDDRVINLTGLNAGAYFLKIGQSVCKFVLL